jgi:hypothetical protein
MHDGYQHQQQPSGASYIGAFLLFVIIIWVVWVICASTFEEHTDRHGRHHEKEYVLIPWRRDGHHDVA